MLPTARSNRSHELSSTQAEERCTTTRSTHTSSAEVAADVTTRASATPCRRIGIRLTFSEAHKMQQTDLTSLHADDAHHTAPARTLSSTIVSRTSARCGVLASARDDWTQCTAIAQAWRARWSSVHEAPSKLTLTCITVCIVLGLRAHLRCVHWEPERRIAIALAWHAQVPQHDYLVSQRRA